jgi:hypothetical protein
MVEGVPLAAPETYSIGNRGNQTLERYVVVGCFREAQAPRPPMSWVAWTVVPRNALAKAQAFRWPIATLAKSDQSRPIQSRRNQGALALGHFVPVEPANSLR